MLPWRSHDRVNMAELFLRLRNFHTSMGNCPNTPWSSDNLGNLEIWLTLSGMAKVLSDNFRLPLLTGLPLFPAACFQEPPRDARMFFRLPGGWNWTGFWLLVTVVLLTLSSIDDEPVVRDISRMVSQVYGQILKCCNSTPWYQFYLGDYWKINLIPNGIN